MAQVCLTQQTAAFSALSEILWPTHRPLDASEAQKRAHHGAPKEACLGGFTIPMSN